MFLSEEKKCQGKRAFFMLKLFLILIGLTPGISVFAQHIDNPECNYINKNDLKEIVNTLAGESLQGRQTGTTGQKKAANYISECFEKAGLAPLIKNSYFEKFNLTEISWGEVYIKTEEERTLHNFEDIIYMSSTILNSEKTFELIFAGDGSREFLNQIDVKNKIVLVFASQLRSAAYKISDSIVSRGAAGILLVNPENDIQFESLIKTFKGFKLQKRFFLNHDTISRFGPDSYLELYAARYNVKGLIGYSYKYLQKQMKLKDISMLQPKTIKLKCEQKNRNIETENILGYLPGKSDSSILISAHYDHLGMNGNILYPGADDNASGVAAMIEIAEEFAHAEKLNYNIIFLATTAEEEGLLGSRFFVNDTLIKPAKIVFNINIDMLGRTDENHRHNESYIYSIGTDQNRKIASLFASADSYFDKANYDYSLDNSNDLAGLYHRADQYNFYSAGIPAVFLTSGLHDDYHKPTDKASSINFSLLENRAKLVYLSLNLIQSGNQFYSDRNFNNKAE